MLVLVGLSREMVAEFGLLTIEAVDFLSITTEEFATV